MFKAMLSERFKEGHELTANGVVEVPLCFDEAEGMTVICNVLHLRNDHVSERVDLSLLEDVAKLADKYDCVKAMKHAARAWLQIYLSDLRAKTLSPSPKALTAAYHFQDARMINEIGEVLVLLADHDLRDQRGSHPLALERLQGALHVSERSTQANKA